MDESKQATWKRVGPVVLTSLVPIVAALGFFAVEISSKKGPANAANQPSMAAFDACLTENDLQPAQSYASTFDQTVASEQEMKVCGDKIPPAVIKSWQQKSEQANAAYRECIEKLAGSSGGGFGRFRRGPSSGFRAAVATCRTLLQGGGSGSTPVVPKKTTAPGPIA
jgi:hypothetical protein